MKRWIAFAAFLCLSGSAGAADGPAHLTIGDLKHVSAFRLPFPSPPGQAWKSTFSFGGTALAFNPKGNSLFLVGHDHHQLAAEVSIPRAGQGPISSLPTARMLQPFADVTGGLKQARKIGGLLVDHDRLLWSVYVYYDGGGREKVSHGVSTLDLSRPEARGVYRLAGVPAGAVGGPMCHVPRAWRKAFGWPILTGLAGVPIVSRTSAGPCAVGFDRADLGPSPAATTVFLFYPLARPLAPLQQTNQLWNLVATMTGMVFVERGGKSALLFFGRRGLGTYWYGPPNMGAHHDPYHDGKGNHAPPYAETAWFYNPQDLLAVKGRRREPWQVKPYAVEKLPGMYPAGGGEVGGAAYDPDSGRLYVSQLFVDRPNQNARLPVIHVYQVGARTSRR
jgi:hypothetical protein